MRSCTRRGVFSGGESLARFIAFSQGFRAFHAMRLTGVLEAFLMAGMADLGAEGAVFGGELGALREEARGERAYVCASARKCHEQRDCF